MHHESYDKLVKFASEGELAEEVAVARAEYVERTGDLFETDESYERRIASFLEWYILDRPINAKPHMTPAKFYIDTVAEQLTTPEISALRVMTRTKLSLFQFKRARPDALRVVDLLTNEKIEVFERRRPAGLDSGDILEARLVSSTDGERVMFSDDTIGFHPRGARKPILKATKGYRKANTRGEGRIDMVHRVAYFGNRCERYSHLDALDVFAEL